jgi:hypothetical protein
MSTPVAETAAVTQPAAPPPPPAPLASRIADTLFAPTRVFEQFRDRDDAPWLGPVFVSLALALLLTALRPLFISNQQMAEMMLQKAAEMGQKNLPSAEQMAGRMGVQVAIGTAFTVAWLFLRPLVFGGILAMLYGLFMGGRASFPAYRAVASHALLVSTLGFLVTMALVFATGRLDLSLDASLVLGPDAKGVAATVLRAITPFSVWTTVLLALGGAVVNRRRGWAGAAAALLSLQLALALAWGLLMQLMTARSGG